MRLLEIFDGDSFPIDRGREYVDQCHKVAWGNTFIEGDTNELVINATKVNPYSSGASVNGLCSASNSCVESERIEERVIDSLESIGLHRVLEHLSKVVDLGGNTAETFGTVIDSVHCRHISEKSLTCTDVAGCLFPTDVLFASYDPVVRVR